MSQIEYPLHLAMDAQGPMGIMDAKGRAVAWFSETFQPAKGYVWEPAPQETPDVPEPGAARGYTRWPERCAFVRALFDFINSQRYEPRNEPPSRNSARPAHKRLERGQGRQVHQGASVGSKEADKEEEGGTPGAAST